MTLSNTELTITRTIQAPCKTSEIRVHELQGFSGTPGVHATIASDIEHKPASNTGYSKALIVTSKFRYEMVYVRTPELAHEQDVIIESRAVGLNPIDWKSVDYNFCLPEFPWITGREMAGIVYKVGSKVKDLAVGDHVWTSTYYRKREAGCFQQFVTVPQHTVMKMPANLDFESASCLGVPGLTAAMTLWHWLKIPYPEPVLAHHSRPIDTLENGGVNKFLLIWGGSTITGQFAIQLARASGLTVITVVSSKTAPLVQSLGAQHVVVRDGKTNDEIVSEIRQVTHDNLTYAIDIVGTDTAAMALKALSSSQPAVIAPLSFLPAKLEIPRNVTVTDIEMKQFILNPENRIYADKLNDLVKSGKIRVPQLEVLTGGLPSIPAGLDRLKQGNMHGKKLVVKV